MFPAVLEGSVDVFENCLIWVFSNVRLITLVRKDALLAGASRCVKILLFRYSSFAFYAFSINFIEINTLPKIPFCFSIVYLPLQ